MRIPTFLGRSTQGECPNVLGLLDDREFQNLTRSTILLQCWWRSIGSHWRAFQSQGFPSLDLFQAIFEYQVPSVRMAKASHTDLMLLGPNRAIGVEAKHREGMYDTVAKWRAKGSDPGFRQEVIDHWIALIDKTCGDVDRLKLDLCEYQALHRVASVCSLDVSAHDAVWLEFRSAESSHEHFPKLTQLKACLRPRAGKLRIWHVAVPSKQGRAWVTAKSAVETLADHEERAEYIRKAIESDLLWEFGPPKFVAV